MQMNDRCPENTAGGALARQVAVAGCGLNDNALGHSGCQEGVGLLAATQAAVGVDSAGCNSMPAPSSNEGSDVIRRLSV